MSGKVVVPGQVRAVPEPKRGKSKMQYFSESGSFPNLLCLKFPLRDNIPKNSFWGVVKEGSPASASASS
jgi:hypothetical protein